jgi:tetratricopeptide (TPR) repeat protein/predicted Ser/Thr protein kinase
MTRNDPDAPTIEGVAPKSLPPPAKDAFERGAVVDRYTILERVGRGGMGEVYAAYDGKLDRRVALKLLLSSDPGVESRLAREAQAMARLSHPNVVAVFDTGVVEGRRFLAMEFVQGTTLRGWARASKRTVEEIVRVYVEAGRGLAAAHDAGLVHRDFKPDNVLVSSQGAVKVTDFGLVRAEEEGAGSRADALERLASRLARDARPGGAPDGADTVAAVPTERVAASTTPASIARTGSLETPMTEEGALLGTLGYMAPEQYLSEPVNAKTDQFSFAVALYDALYEQKPFAGKGVLELADATVNGRVREPPRGSAVPSHVHRVILRALRPEKADRYPSMRALLEDLQRDPVKDRLRVVGVGVALAAVAALFVLSQRVATARQGRLCAAAEPLAHEVWNDAVAREMGASMAATGLPFAGDTFARAREQIDGYVARWSRMHEATCRATRVDGHQPEALMAVRMACLEQRRAQVRTLTRVLSHADRPAVERAVEASRNLPSVDDCADVTSLTAVQALPVAADKRAEVEALGRDVGDLRVRADAGKYKEVTVEAAGAVERAKATGYEPLVAEAFLVLADAQDHLGMKSEAAASAREALYAAEAGRAEDLKVRSLVLLEGVLAELRKFDDARATSRLVSASSSRLTDPEAYRADAYAADAWVACREGKYDDSAAAFRKAIAVAERNADARPVRVARMYSRAGGMLGEAGHFDEAFDLLDRADATFARELGAEHPLRVTTAVNRGATLLDQGRWADALATSEAALTLAARVLPKESGTVANLENNRADALHELARYEEARAAAQRAVDIGKATFGPRAVNTAGYMITLGEALAGLGRHDEAVATLDEVLGIIEPTLAADHEWLAEARSDRGDSNVARHRPREALADLERSLAIYSTIKQKTVLARGAEALARAALARALVETSGRSPRASELASAAIDAFAALHEDDRARAVVEWSRAAGVLRRGP